MAGFGSFDFTELKKLAKNLKDLERALPAFFEECVRDLALALLAKTVRRTPVDTGELRRNWTVGPIRREGSAYEVELFNPTDYAAYVEFGHRLKRKEGHGWVEGRFMMTISEEELDREMPAIIDRKLQRLMDRFLGGRI